MDSPFALGDLSDLNAGLKPSLLMRRLRDERGELMVPDPWQERYVDCEDPAILLLAYRQSGKTTGTAIKSLRVGLFEPGRLTLIISPTDRQSGIVLDRVKNFYGQLGGSLGKTSRDTASELRFENDARIVSLPGGNPDQIRGFSNVRLLVCDEGARIPDETFTAVLPMLAEDGQVVCLTTPRGRGGFFFREWHDGEGWTRIRATPEDSPRMTEARLAAQRRKLTAHQFSVEYGLSFGGSDTSLFPAELIESCMDRSVELLKPDWPRFGGGG